jgi:hypothetical protein
MVTCRKGDKEKDERIRERKIDKQVKDREKDIYIDVYIYIEREKATDIERDRYRYSDNHTLHVKTLFFCARVSACSSVS